MAGFCKTIKQGGKDLLRELNKQVMRSGIGMMTLASSMIADGKITSTEGREFVGRTLSEMHGITIGAGLTAVEILHKSFNAELEDASTPSATFAQAADAVLADVDGGPDDISELIEAA